MSFEHPEEQLTPEQQRIAELEQENEQLKQEIKELREISLVDPLTRTLNRRGLNDMAERILAQRDVTTAEKREKIKPVAVLVLDIDNFKIVNDAFGGHAVGDRILQEAADYLKNSVRGSDIVARIGGEEFAIVFNNAEDHDIVDKFFDKTTGRARVSFTTVLDGEEVPINFSGGVTMLAPNETIKNLNDAIDRADRALYASKEAGRDRITLYNEELNSPKT